MKINRIDMLLHSIRRLLSRNAESHIRRLLAKSHPSEIAAVIRQLPDDDGVYVINQIRNATTEPETFVELEGRFVETYLDITKDKEHIAAVMHKLPEDEVAALLAELEEETKQEILSLMQFATKEEVNEILQYGEDTCGRIMAVNVQQFHQNLTAKEAIEQIQNSSHLESIYYIYVVDDDEELVGVVSLRQLLQVQGSRVLKDFMIRDVVKINVFDSQEKAAEMVEEYNFVSLPVVDDEGILLGMITVDDVIDYIREEAQDDVLQMAGVEAEAIDDFSYLRAFGSRTFWYAMLFIGGVLCSEIILYYFQSIPKEVMLFCFAPLVLRLGGSVATQTHTFVTQAVLEVDIERSRAAKAFWGQILITLLVSVLLAVVVFLYSHFRFADTTNMPLALSLGVLIVTLVSIGVGCLVPVISKKIRLDPQLVSSRFVHFLMDALSLLVYFRVITVMIG